MLQDVKQFKNLQHVAATKSFAVLCYTTLIFTQKNRFVY